MKPLLLSASLALMLLSSAAFAAPGHGDHGAAGWNHGHDGWNHDGDRDHGDRGHGDRDYGDRDYGDRGHDRGDRDDRDRDAWRDQHDGRWSERRYYSDHDNGRHRGYYRQDFRHGDRLPVMYMQPRYYVRDWDAYRLAPPPRGYMWVRPPDGRFLLVAATTGLIAEILGY